MTAKVLMVQGSMSSVGKSLLVTALCRIFARQGVRVAPFKAQNMSNNAAVCADGGEIGRAQYTQALAAGIAPTVQMNPVLLKPEADMRSQVVVNGRVWETLPARNYDKRKQWLWGEVTTALDALRDEHELIVVEGAGSPAELNLKRGDIVNMAVARYADAAVLLAGDIDRGGIFAQLLGTLDLLEPEERDLVRGLIVNRFRGDPTLFEDGVTILEERSRVPVLGVVPYLHEHGLPEEDAVAVEDANVGAAVPDGDIVIAVIRLPRIANFDDFDPLAAEPGVTVCYVTSSDAVVDADAVIIPGTKSTIADLAWMRERGLDVAVQRAANQGAAVVGICGGYQMLGSWVRDPHQVEGNTTDMIGLGLLPVETDFVGDKSTRQVNGIVSSENGWLSPLNGTAITGYEIHMGRTPSPDGWLAVDGVLDGAITTDGRIWGCYLHGLFANDALRQAWLQSVGWSSVGKMSPSVDATFDRVADHVEAALDMRNLAAIVGL